MEYLDEIIATLRQNRGGNYMYVSTNDNRITSLIDECLAALDDTELRTKFYFLNVSGLKEFKPDVPFECVYIDAGISGIVVNQYVNAKQIKLVHH